MHVVAGDTAEEDPRARLEHALKGRAWARPQRRQTLALTTAVAATALRRGTIFSSHTDLTYTVLKLALCVARAPRIQFAPSLTRNASF